MTFNPTSFTLIPTSSSFTTLHKSSPPPLPHTSSAPDLSVPLHHDTSGRSPRHRGQWLWSLVASGQGHVGARRAVALPALVRRRPHEEGVRSRGGVRGPISGARVAQGVLPPARWGWRSPSLRLELKFAGARALPRTYLLLTVALLLPTPSLSSTHPAPPSLLLR
jgi:hypothetical protein